MTWIDIQVFLESHVKEIWLVLWMLLWTWWDLQYRVICRWQGLLVVAAGVLWQGIDGQLFTASVLGGLALGAFAWGFSWVSEDRFGRGDAMVILCLGLYLGFGSSLSVMMWGLLIASVLSLYLLWVRKRTKDQSIPFIPCLMAGYLMQSVIWWISG